MRIEKVSRNLKLPEILVIYFSIAFVWELIFSPFYSQFDNVGFFASSASALSVYFIAKYFLKPNFLGRSIRYSDAPQIFLISIATVFVGIGSWGLLVYSDALLNGNFAMKRWGLISVHDFKELRWSKPWLVGHLIISSFLAPIMEEIIFRGFILNRLRECYSAVFSLVISAALFAVFHYDKSFIGAFVHGVIFGVLAIRLASLYAPILVHCLYNATIFILTIFYGLSIVGDGELLSRLSYWTSELLCGLVGCVLLVIYFIVFPWDFQEERKTICLELLNNEKTSA